jgi:hypothetical protein
MDLKTFPELEISGSPQFIQCYIYINPLTEEKNVTSPYSSFCREAATTRKPTPPEYGVLHLTAA